MNDFDLEKTLNSDLTNISKDMLEIGLDSVFKEGLLKDIPVINALMSFVGIGLNIKDRLFIRKLLYFLYEIKKVPIERRIQEIEKINKSNRYKSTVGEKLISLIDKSDELNKAQLLGELFNYVLSLKIEYNMFLRCANSINKSYISDLEWFLDSSHLEYKSSLECDGLLNSGILRFVAAEGPVYLGGASFDLKYDISDVGYCIHQCLGNKEYKIKKLND